MVPKFERHLMYYLLMYIVPFFLNILGFKFVLAILLNLFGVLRKSVAEVSSCKKVIGDNDGGGDGDGDGVGDDDDVVVAGSEHWS